MSNKKKVALSDNDLEQVVGGLGDFGTGAFNICGFEGTVSSNTDTNGFGSAVNGNTDTNGVVANPNMMSKPAIS